MNAEVHVRYLHCGDSAVAVEFGETADIAISVKVRALDVALKENPIRGITELIPTYRSEMRLKSAFPNSSRQSRSFSKA